MTAEISFLDRQREAAEAARAATRRGEGPPWNAKASRLLAAGWREKWRSRRRIWSHPETGYWYGEDFAYAILEGKEK